MPVDTDFAVIEIGMNHPGEIAPLARLARLDVAMITIVAPAHLEAFDSIDGIAHEKAAIFDGLQPGGHCRLQRRSADNADPAGQGLGHRCASGGLWQCRRGRLASGRGSDQRRSHGLPRHAAGQPMLYKVSSPGRHFALNALGALAVAEALGCRSDDCRP
jgi:UDP-N-acetylmuramoyl-tripeptide--D-alanyl-D-alanine ligase